MAEPEDRLWRAGLDSSPQIRRMIDLYPSFRHRLVTILETAEPRVAQTVGLLLERADSARRETPTADVLELRFGITPAEARLMAGLAAGLSLAEHAERAGVTLQTARNQLQSVFQKTGVNRQTDLVRLALRAAPKVTAVQKNRPD